jgi:hypothetical protein
MSRGLGKFQNSLLSYLDEGPCFRGQLMWSIAEDFEKIDRDKAKNQVLFGKIQSSFEKQFSDAIIKLESKDYIVRKKKYLCRFEDLERYYPTKTSSLEVKNLRSQLLSTLLEEVKSPTGAILYRTKLPNYKLLENEDYRWESLPPDASKVCREKWKEIESLLGSLMASPSRARRTILRLLSRGNELFVPKSGITCKHSFSDLATSLEKTLGDENFTVFQSLNSLCFDAFPQNEMEHLKIKSKLYHVGNFGGQGVSSLKKEVKEFLLNKHPDILKSLSGHQKGGVIGTSFDGPIYDVQFDPLLDRLVERDAFGKFEFIERRLTSTKSTPLDS